jgi:hypothetical protein
MYYHCRPLKYVEYGKIYPPPVETLDEMFLNCYNWIGNYCHFSPQVWLSRSVSSITGYKNNRMTKKRQSYINGNYLKEKLDSVIKELAEITTNLGFFSIHMGPATKILADGRNAHLIQKPSSWWLPLLTPYFDVLHLETHQMMGNGFWIIVKPKEVLS